MSQTLKSGCMIDGFEIIGMKADSAWGTVYMVKPKNLNRTFALKVAKDGSAEKIINEREALAAIGKHPNVTEIFFAGTDIHDNPYIVEDYVGSNLAELLNKRERKTIDHALALSITSKILTGLLAAHAKGIIHQDLKPENILIEKCKTAENIIQDIVRGQETYQVKLCDFGMASIKHVEPELVSSLEDATGAAGTLKYLSPEQKDGGRVTQKTDIYTVGLVLYKMLTGKLPHINYPKASQVHYPSKGSFNEMRTKWGWVDDIIEKALQPNPKDRYPTVTAMLSAIEKGLTPEKEEPKGPSLAERTKVKIKGGAKAFGRGTKKVLIHTARLPIYLLLLPMYLGYGISKFLEDKFRYSHDEIGFFSAIALAIGYYFIMPCFIGEAYLKYHLEQNPTNGTIIAFHDDSDDQGNKHFLLIDASKLPEIRKIKVAAPDVSSNEPLYTISDDGKLFYYTTSSSLVEVNIKSKQRKTLAKSEILGRFNRIIHQNDRVYALLDTEVWSVSREDGLKQHSDNLDALEIPEMSLDRGPYQLDKEDFPSHRGLEFQFKAWYLVGNFPLDEDSKIFSWLDTSTPFNK